MIENRDRIFRLLNYKNLLYRLKNMGFKKVFSDNISDTFNISSSLVRKDFIFFGIKGSQKGGYDIDSVLDRIKVILGKDKIQDVIIVGTGRIGQALMNYKGFFDEGIHIKAGFDIDTNKIENKADIPVYHMNQLKDYVADNDIQIAILAVPKLAAQQTTHILESVNIKGILNFTALKISAGEDVIINNVNIVSELEKLIYLVNNKTQ